MKNKIYFQERILSRTGIEELLQFFLLFGLSVLVPFFLHNQWFVGPIVNAILIVTWAMLGLKMALAIALVPSLIALSSGTLPIVLAPAIPFIMIGNAIYIISINYICSHLKDNYWVGIFLGAGLKFTFLFLGAGFILQLFIDQAVLLKINQMMTWIQFVTAVLGGALAWLILKKIKKI